MSLCKTTSLTARHQLPRSASRQRWESTPRIAFLSPEPQREEHLHLLRSLSALARDNAMITAIANAKSGEDVVALLKR